MTRNVALDTRDRRLVDMLVAGRSQVECADALGVNRRTVGRRAKRPAFVTALAQAEAEVTRTARRRLAAKVCAMADVLAHAAEDPDVPPATRVAAAGRLIAVWASLQPHELDATVAVEARAPWRREEPFSVVLDRMAARMGIVHEPASVPTGNGQERRP
jgi:hypothetical protein